MAEQKRASLRLLVVFTICLLPVVYVASLGPACWIVSRTEQSPKIMNVGYRPLLWLLVQAPRPIRQGMIAYAECGQAAGWGFHATVTGTERLMYRPLPDFDLLEMPAR